MKIAELLPSAEEWKQLRDIESTLLRRRTGGRLAGMVAIGLAALQMVLAIAEKSYFDKLVRAANSIITGRFDDLAAIGFDRTTIAAWVILLLAAVGYLLLRRTSVLLKESKEAFRYTFWIEPFTAVANTPGGRFTLDSIDRFELLHHDLTERLDQRIRRFSVLKEWRAMETEDPAKPRTSRARTLSTPRPRRQLRSGVGAGGGGVRQVSRLPARDLRAHRAAAQSLVRDPRAARPADGRAGKALQAGRRTRRHAQTHTPARFTEMVAARGSSGRFEARKNALFDLYVASALALHFLERSEQSVERLADAAATAPDRIGRDPLYLVVLGLVEPVVDKAILYYRQAVEIVPDFQIAQWFLAQACERQFRREDEITHERAKSILREYDRVLTINCGNISALSASGCLRWMVRAPCARECLEEGREVKAIAAEAFVGELSYKLARVAAEAGSFDECRSLYVEAISAVVQHESVDDAQRLLPNRLLAGRGRSHETALLVDEARGKRKQLA